MLKIAQLVLAVKLEFKGKAVSTIIIQVLILLHHASSLIKYGKADSGSVHTVPWRAGNKSNKMCNICPFYLSALLTLTGLSWPELLKQYLQASSTALQF